MASYGTFNPAAPPVSAIDGSAPTGQPEYATVTEVAILRGMIEERNQQIVALTQNLDEVRKIVKNLEQRATRQSRLSQFHDKALKELREDLRGIKASSPEDGS